MTWQGHLQCRPASGEGRLQTTGFRERGHLQAGVIFQPGSSSGWGHLQAGVIFMPTSLWVRAFGHKRP